MNEPSNESAWPSASRLGLSRKNLVTLIRLAATIVSAQAHTRQLAMMRDEVHWSALVRPERGAAVSTAPHLPWWPTLTDNEAYERHHVDAAQRKSDDARFTCCNLVENARTFICTFDRGRYLFLRRRVFLWRFLALPTLLLLRQPGEKYHRARFLESLWPRNTILSYIFHAGVTKVRIMIYRFETWGTFSRTLGRLVCIFRLNVNIVQYTYSMLNILCLKQNYW